MDRGDVHRRSLMTKLVLGVLTCNSALAVYRSWGDPASVGFVASAYAALLLLLHLLRRFERARPGDDDRGRAKAAVWALSTLLTAMFASRVAPVMPPMVGVAVWVMVVATAGAGLWSMFR
ncbi:hypothetical protein BAE44_0013014 [Dichanthelium oligosanthes]|uniref:Uncharacterized protein n=1 Tax=Dichanthelium oligosanthes TaxID=888268 RepID=A0A1E5VLL6_9POAL|nr:hypothetical protein BAE44_0013014 [Dichanthelium oligosanthes]